MFRSAVSSACVAYREHCLLTKTSHVTVCRPSCTVSANTENTVSFVYSVCQFCSIITKVKICRQILIKIPDILFYEWRCSLWREGRTDSHGESSMRIETALRKCQIMLRTQSTLHNCGNATCAEENGEMTNRWTKSERSFVSVTQFI
jgi:hypothetical protein